MGRSPWCWCSLAAVGVVGPVIRGRMLLTWTGRVAEKPRSGRVQGVRRQVASGHNETNQQLRASHPPNPRRPRLPGQEKAGFSPSAIFPRSSATSRIPSTRRASPQPAPTTIGTSLLHRLLALGSAPPAVQSAPRVAGRWSISWFTAGGADAAQTVWTEAASPSPTDQAFARHAGQTHNAGPRSSGDRASVS